jgi:hypothetical protein
MFAKAKSSSSTHGVPLTRLPADFSIPADLQNRFWYDQAERRLVFDGFMSKSAYDRLCLLSNDLDYREALDDLFRIAVPEDEVPSKAPVMVWVACLVGGLIAAATVVWAIS